MVWLVWLGEASILFNFNLKNIIIEIIKKHEKNL